MTAGPLEGVASGAGTRPERADLGALARGGALNLAGAVANGLLGFALVVVVTRGLGAAGAGVLFESVALFTILATSAMLGADVGLARMLPRYLAFGRDADLRRAVAAGLWPVLVAGTAAGIAVAASAEGLARAFSGDRGDVAALAGQLRMLAPFLPLAGAALVALAATRGLGTMGPSVLLDKLARPVLQVLLVLAAVLAGTGGELVAVAWAAPFALVLAGALGWLGRRTRDAGGGRARPARVLLGELWGFAGPRALAAIFQVTSLWVNVLVVGALSGAGDAGVYAAAARYLVAGQLVALAIRQALGPQLSELLARRARDRAGATYRTATTWTVGLAWPWYLALVAFAPVLLGVFGGGFQDGAVALQVMAAAMLLGALAGPVDVVLLMGGRSGWNLANTAAALATNLLLGFALVPRLGVTGAALAWAASVALGNLAALAQVRRWLGLHPFGRSVGTAAVLAAACFGLLGLVARWLLGASPGALAAYVLLATACYAALAWLARHRLGLHTLAAALRRGTPSPEAAT